MKLRRRTGLLRVNEKMAGFTRQIFLGHSQHGMPIRHFGGTIKSLISGMDLVPN